MPAHCPDRNPGRDDTFVSRHCDRRLGLGSVNVDVGTAVRADMDDPSSDFAFRVSGIHEAPFLRCAAAPDIVHEGLFARDTVT